MEFAETSSASSFLEEFLRAGRNGWEELASAYRRACLKSHPDTGGSHEAFLRVQQDYRKALAILRESEPAETGLSSSLGQRKDPLEVLFEEAGYPPLVDVRARFYFCVDLYYRFSLYGSAAREQTSLKSRNGLVLSSLLEYGSRYDPGFGQRFAEYHEQRTLTFRSTPQARTWANCHGDFWTGWDYFFRYQAQGRLSSRRMAETYWVETVQRLRRAGIESSALELFANWFLNELEKSPLLFEI